MASGQIMVTKGGQTMVPGTITSCIS